MVCGSTNARIAHEPARNQRATVEFAAKNAQLITEMNLFPARVERFELLLSSRHTAIVSCIAASYPGLNSTEDQQDGEDQEGFPPHPFGTTSQLDPVAPTLRSRLTNGVVFLKSS